MKVDNSWSAKCFTLLFMLNQCGPWFFWEQEVVVLRTENEQLKRKVMTSSIRLPLYSTSYDLQHTNVEFMLWEQILMTTRRPWPHCFRSILQSFVYEINISEPMHCVWMLTFICTHLHLQVTDLEEQLMCYQVSAGVSRAIASIIAIVFLVFQPATTTQWQVYWFSHCNKDMGVEGFTFLMHIWTNNVICDGCYQMGLALMKQAPHFCSCADTSKKSLSKRAWIFFLISKTPWSTSSICVWEQETPFNSSTSTRCNALSSGCTCKFQT